MFTIKDILRIEVAPALGCTEPAAVSLCTAAAASVLKTNEVESIAIYLSPSIYKNAFAVAIPGTQGQVGIDLAAGVGFYGGDPNLKLQVLATIQPAHIEAARQLINRGGITIHLLNKTPGIYIRSVVKTAAHTAEAIIEKTHNNLTSLTLNGQNVTDSALMSDIAENRGDIDELEAFLREQSLESLLVLVEQMDEEDYAFVQEGIDSNIKLATHGLAFGCGLGVGKMLER